MESLNLNKLDKVENLRKKWTHVAWPARTSLVEKFEVYWLKNEIFVSFMIRKLIVNVEVENLLAKKSK